MTPRLITLIEQGDASRDAGDWLSAVHHYPAAVKEAPELRHIWIQLGHARKESGDLDGAEAAYLSADHIAQGDGEPALHLGHVAKLRGNRERTRAFYLRCIDENPESVDAARELESLADSANVSKLGLERALRRRASRRNGHKSATVEALTALGSLLSDGRILMTPDQAQSLALAKSAIADICNAAPQPAPPANDRDAVATLVFDASDLFSYFRNARLPTGIQRVQIEVISKALASNHNTHVCCFSDISDTWIEVAPDLFRELCEFAIADGSTVDPAWRLAIEELAASLIVGDEIAFAPGAFLVNLGTSWWLQNYFLHIRDAKERFGIRYVPFVHDLIPIMTPEHCVDELTQDFVTWTLGVFQHADFFLVNSEATRTDLIKVACSIGHVVDPARIEVIRLNADFKQARPAIKTMSRRDLGKWQLRDERYVLFVSTIESRKNHALAFDAWLALIERHGADKVPRLVCVGNNGWLNDTVYSKLRNPQLAERVLMLSRLSDAELDLLYENCLFTLYPSLYEGWGLPVTEALCHGKVPLISDSSSLPEAGGKFAIYFSSGSLEDLTGRLDRLILDDSYRAAQEELIKSEFRPRPWTDIVEQISGILSKFADMTPRSGPAKTPSTPPIQFGDYYPIERNFERRVWRGSASAEIFRAGTGWWWPDNWGCWTKPQGGRLRINLPNAGGIRAYFLLHGLPETACNYEIAVADLGIRLHGTLHGGEFRWVGIDMPDPAPYDEIDIVFTGSTKVDLAERTGGLDRRVISLARIIHRVVDRASGFRFLVGGRRGASLPGMSRRSGMLRLAG